MRRSRGRSARPIRRHGRDVRRLRDANRRETGYGVYGTLPLRRSPASAAPRHGPCTVWGRRQTAPAVRGGRSAPPANGVCRYKARQSNAGSGAFTAFRRRTGSTGGNAAGPVYGSRRGFGPRMVRVSGIGGASVRGYGGLLYESPGVGLLCFVDLRLLPPDPQRRKRGIGTAIPRAAPFQGKVPTAVRGQLDDRLFDLVVARSPSRAHYGVRRRTGRGNSIQVLDATVPDRTRPS